MKSTLFIVIAMISGLLLNSCSGIKILSDKDEAVDFTKFKTYQYYGWAEESNKMLNELDQRRIEKAFSDEFAKRNLKYVEENGDIMVTLYIVTEQKSQTTANTTGMGGMGGYGYGGYYGYGPAYGWGGGMSTTTYSTTDYTVGTLVVDVYDETDKKLVWEGVAKGTIKDNPKGRDSRITAVVEGIMKRYPVAAPKK